MQIEIKFKCAGCKKTFYSPPVEMGMENGRPVCPSPACSLVVANMVAPEPPPTRHQFRNSGDNVKGRT